MHFMSGLKGLIIAADMIIKVIFSSDIHISSCHISVSVILVTTAVNISK